MEPSRTHLLLCMSAVLLCCVSTDEEREALRSKEGGTVTLRTRKDGCDSNPQVVWMFGPESANKRIARMKNGEVKLDYIDHFRDRLELDHQSGSLTISGLKHNDSGVYMCQSIGSKIFSQLFNLTVYASIYAPTIRTNSLDPAGACSSLAVECSVQSGRELELSWFRGGDKLMETSRPDSSSMLRLSLLIQSGGEDVYTCVAENPVDQKSSRIHTKDTCLNNGEALRCQTEVTVRLAVSAVLGLVLMVLVVDHVRFRRRIQPRLCGSRCHSRRENKREH
ncbi:hepatocyte cell adhesion molecule-like [Cheilinus undulatus]|uniref:hepatocyte cell adhesion molecule-like n=1 Tax=Cheilinus undulatus TaxID=241271 RepID=UPI001BD2018F|nr:hepatocyte cell adhesion molecule-like [Cheilinus undulatus]